MKYNKILLTLLLIPIVLIFNTAHASVIVGDKEWRQPTETEGLSWNQVATVCPTGGGLCDGVLVSSTLGSVDLTGWNWATIEDVADLFTSYNPGFIGPISVSAEVNSTWAPAFLNDFMPTNIFIEQLEVIGITSTTVFDINDTFARIGLVVDNPLFDSMSTNTLKPLDQSDAATGIWLYTVIPLPPAVWLFGSALLGLVGISRRKKFFK